MIRRAISLLAQRGPLYPWYLFSGVLVPQVEYRLSSRYANVFSVRRFSWAALVGLMIMAFLPAAVLPRKVAGIWAVTIGALALLGTAFVLIHRRRVLLVSLRTVGSPSGEESGFLRWQDWTSRELLDPEVIAALPAVSPVEVVLGRIDSDGRLLGHFGSIPGFEMIDARSFTERYRYDLDLVLVDGLVLIRKDFRGDRTAFHREWSALAALGPMIRAPKVHSVDKEKLILYKAFVPGRTLREQLAEGGARILIHQTSDDPELAELSPRERIEAVWRRGRQALDTSNGECLIGSLEAALEAVHCQGVTGFSLTFGNVVVHERTGEPWLIDFDAAKVHRFASGIVFNSRRDLDRGLFNRIYGTSLITESSARTWLGDQKARYSPVDLGRGLVTPGFWSVDSGMGRWEYLNGPVLRSIVQGRRILDLGSNNGVMSLMLNRDGADEVLALERDPNLVLQACQMRSIFEWKDMRPYNVEFRQEDMRIVCSGELGSFDVVSAFCSLYYLDEQDMSRVALAVREIAPTFVVQAKSDTRTNAAEGKAKKSSVEYLCNLLGQCGFQDIRVTGPHGYSRLLIIARAK